MLLSIQSLNLAKVFGIEPVCHQFRMGALKGILPPRKTRFRGVQKFCEMAAVAPAAPSPPRVGVRRRVAAFEIIMRSTGSVA